MGVNSIDLLNGKSAPNTLGQEPSFDLTKEHGAPGSQFVQQLPGGGKATDYATIQKMRTEGWQKCPNPSCDFWIDPQALARVSNSSGYFTCPKCHHSYDLLEELPWHGPEHDYNEPFAAGGGTRIGIPMQDQAQIGENLIEHMGELPGYGPITWWHPGGALSNSPLDGAVKDWGIEVKTIGYDALHHRFIPGREKEKADKNQQAAEMGLKGVLGVLVLLDYRRDVADIYVKEMPLEPWTNGRGMVIQGVAAFRKNSAQRLVAEVPFQNPYKDPNNPAPATYTESEPMPF